MIFPLRRLLLRGVFVGSTIVVPMRDTEIEILKGDITKIRVDAIVNAANTSLLGGAGVDGAIHRAAGPGLLEECKGLHGCETGEAKMTGGYGLFAGYVIHTVGPVYGSGRSNEGELLASCYRNSLELAKTHCLKTIAFPSISTGAYRFPIERAAPIALRTLQSFLDKHPRSLEKVVFVLFSEGDLKIYEKLYKEIFLQNNG